MNLLIPYVQFEKELKNLRNIRIMPYGWKLEVAEL